MAEKETKYGCEEKESTPKAVKNASIVTDDELDSLLDDALKDFSKPELAVASSDNNVKEATSTSSKNFQEGQQAFDEKDFENFFTEEGLAKMTEELSKAFGDLPNMNFDLLKEMGGSTSDQNDEKEGLAMGKSLEENLENAWKSMAQNLKDTKEERPDDFLDKEFMNAMKGLGLENADASPDNFISMMQGMMANLLSKDLLYPSLKEIQMRYPAWLEENKSELSDDEYTRFSRQQEFVARICFEFESEKDDDSEEVKKARMEKIMELMQKMQEYGQPPLDVLGQVEGEETFGKPNFGSPEQCVCM